MADPLTKLQSSFNSISGVDIKAIEISIITAIIKALSIVPIPGFWFKGNQKSKTPMLKNRVIVPIDKSTFNEIPWAKTLHGEAPVNETINNPSPNPNNVKPKHKKKKVENFGFKFKGLSELQETLGIFLIVKNIFIYSYLQFTWLFFHIILLIFNKNY